MKTHILEFDGYTVGDRYLDGVIFLVEIEEHGPNDFRVVKMNPREDALAYLAGSRIDWESFFPDVKERIYENIATLLSELEAEGNAHTIRDEMEQFVKEFRDDDYNEIDFLMEV